MAYWDVYWLPKDPDENAVYSLNVGPDLEVSATVQEPIASFTVSSSIVGSDEPSDLLTMALTVNGTRVRASCSGGTIGRTYLVTFDIVTSWGNELRRSAHLPIRKR